MSRMPMLWEHEKRMSIWSDEESEKGDSPEEVGMVALTAVTKVITISYVTLPESESSDNDTEMSDEIVDQQYKILFGKWEKHLKILGKLKQEKHELITKIQILEENLFDVSQKLDESEKSIKTITEDFTTTKQELTRVNKYMNMMNIGSSTLQKILDAQKSPKDKTGIGCGQETVSEEHKYVTEDMGRRKGY